MLAVFSLDQVLACTESATSQYSTLSQCLRALLGRPGNQSKIYPKRPQVEKKTNTPITPIRTLASDSVPLGVINTSATRGDNVNHCRGGGGPVRMDTSPFKKESKKPEGETPAPERS